MSDTRCDQATVQEHVERAQAGIAESWAWLYRRCRPRLLAYASRRLDRTAAEDAVSETMTRAVEGLASFRWSGAGFDGWVYGICRNVILERYRSMARSEVAVELPDVVDIDADPARHLDRAERHREIAEAFHRLDDADREILTLRVVLEMPSHDVGALLGKRPGAVRMAQNRAVARLRRHHDDIGGRILQTA